MRIGLLDLPSGISGDMFLGALVDAGASPAGMEAAVRAVGGERLGLRAGETMRAGLRGVHVDVLVDGVPLVEPGGPAGTDPPKPAATADDDERARHHHGSAPHHDDERARHHHGSAPHHDDERAHDGHHHRAYREIVGLLEKAALAEPVRRRALAVFDRLGEVEARLHGVTPADVHFHEVGSLDAIADVVGTVAGLDSLGLDGLYHGPVSVGGGRIDAAHGVLPVPAPATLALLEGRACRFEDGAGELTTPTGAALLSVLAEPVPPGLAMKPSSTGYGAGRQDPPGRPNLARLIIGETAGASDRGRVAVVETSLDDCTPEEGGHLIRVLLDAGALDVTLTPIIMKKGRPGFLLRVVAPADRAETFAARVVHESSSLGARWRVDDRMTLERRMDRVRLDDGEVRVKVAILPDGGERPHVEFEDLAELARRRGVPLAELRRVVERRWRETR